jgi:hypothetical protein
VLEAGVKYRSEFCWATIVCFSRSNNAKPVWFWAKIGEVLTNSSQLGIAFTVDLGTDLQDIRQKIRATKIELLSNLGEIITVLFNKNSPVGQQ